MAPHSSTLAWRIPWMEEPGRLQSMGSWRVRHDWATSLSRIGDGNGNPLQCFCLENPRDGGAWWAAVSGVAQSQTRLKWLSSSSSSFYMYWETRKLVWSLYCDIRLIAVVWNWTCDIFMVCLCIFHRCTLSGWGSSPLHNLLSVFMKKSCWILPMFFLHPLGWWCVFYPLHYWHSIIWIDFWC